MSVNKYLLHVFVLLEDDANRQLANGFILDDSLSIRRRRIHVLEEVGGWTEVLARFRSDHVIEMDRNPHRFMVLLFDFDGREDRLDIAKAAIPDRLTDRVFVLGAKREPEALRATLGSYETIGKALADDCRNDIIRLGRTTSFDIMQTSLLACASTFARSCSRPIERTSFRLLSDWRNRGFRLMEG